MRRYRAALTGASTERKGGLSIVAATGSAQLLTLGAAPILARLYEPSSFGTLTIVTALAAMLVSFASLRFDLAIPLPPSDSSAVKLLRIGLLSSVAICLLACGAIITFHDDLEFAVGAEATPWLWAFPAAALSISAAQLLNQMAIRKRLYGLVAQQSVLRTLVTLASQFSIAAVAGPLGLLVGFIVGPAASAGLIGFKLRNQLVSLSADGTGREVARRFRRFPLQLAPAGFLNAAGLQAPLLLIAAQYGSVVVGILGLIQRLLTLPGTILGQAIAQVYLGQISGMRRDAGGGAFELFKRTSRRLTLMSAAGVLLTLAFSPLLGNILGPGWQTSGAFARAMALGVAAQLVVSPVSQTLVVLQRTGLQLTWDTARFAATIGTIQVCVVFGATPLQCVWAYSIATTLMYALLWAITYQALRAAGREAEERSSTADSAGRTRAE